LLSNGVLFPLPDVRRAACEAEVVKASLSAWDQASFDTLNRPHPDLRWDRILAGLHAFREEFTGEFWIEVMLVRGVNDRRESVARVAALVNALHADRVHLNTVVRPPAEAGTPPVAETGLRALAALFKPQADVVANATHDRPAAPAGGATTAEEEDRVLALVRRHPASLTDIALSLGVPTERAEGLVTALETRGLLRLDPHGASPCYVAVA
jgi:wyosine [tRNA(Phe)-imidazoG37] synthetase (radical SAM superfamily)